MVVVVAYEIAVGWLCVSTLIRGWTTSLVSLQLPVV